MGGLVDEVRTYYLQSGDKDNVMFFQNGAIGIIPVDQREAIPDQTGSPLLIGYSTCSPVFNLTLCIR